MNSITRISIVSITAAFALAGAFFLLAPSFNAQAAEGGCCGGGAGSFGHNDNGNTVTQRPPSDEERRVVTPAPICTLSVSPSPITHLDEAQLTWSTSNVTSVTFTSTNGDSSTSNLSSGSIRVSPDRTTTYTGVFRGPGGSVTCNATLTIVPVPPPPPPPAQAPVCSMYASRTSVQKGETVNITWTSSNATAAQISPEFGGEPTNSTRTTSALQQTTTYSGVFTGPGGSVTCSVTITVTTPPPPPHYDAPVCMLYASPSTIEKGNSATLSWNSTNATSATFNQGIGSVAPDGSRSVSPQQTTTYTGTFSGQGGTVTCSKTITVIVPHKPGPTCEMWVSPSSIKKGDDAKLSWASTNANSATINQGIGSVDVDDSVTVSPNKTTTYTGTFYGSNGQQVTCNATVIVKTKVPHKNLSCDLEVSDNKVSSGDKVTLTWDSEDADKGSINHGIGRVNESGSKKVTIKDTTTFTGTFSNDDDEVTCKVTVKVEDHYIPLPPQTPYVTLSSVPYTGLDLGPVGTVVYWSFMVLWCLLAAYLIAIKRVHEAVLASVKGFLFGEYEETGSTTEIPSPYQAPIDPAPVLNMDPFLASQLNRNTRA
ncbi:hypothetical protein H7X87_00120 [Acetobacteraceae bacterium]|nr:hypothetical protein [Candidatus Parcubacteria bacterium]